MVQDFQGRASSITMGGGVYSAHPTYAESGLDRPLLTEDCSHSCLGLLSYVVVFPCHGPGRGYPDRQGSARKNLQASSGNAVPRTGGADAASQGPDYGSGTSSGAALTFTICAVAEPRARLGRRISAKART